MKQILSKLKKLENEKKNEEKEHRVCSEVIGKNQSTETITNDGRKNEVSELLALPIEIQSEIVSYLPASSISALSRTSQKNQNFIMAKHIESSSDSDRNTSHCSNELMHQPSILFKNSNLIWKPRFKLKFPTTYEKYKNSKHINWREALKEASLFGLIPEPEMRMRTRHKRSQPKCAMLPYFVKTGNLDEIKINIKSENISDICWCYRSNTVYPETYQTLLRLANSYQQQEILDYFYELLCMSDTPLSANGIEINIGDNEKDPITLAVVDIHFNKLDSIQPVITKIFESESDEEINKPDGLFMQILSIACELQNKALVNTLLDKRSERLQQKEAIFHWSSQHRISAFSSLEIIKVLSDHGLSLLSEDKDYTGAILAAADSGNREVFAFLLDKSNFQDNPLVWLRVFSLIFSRSRSMFSNATILEIMQCMPTNLQLSEPRYKEDIMESTVTLMNRYALDVVQQWFTLMRYHFTKEDWSYLLIHAVIHNNCGGLEMILEQDNVDVNLSASEKWGDNTSLRKLPLVEAIRQFSSRVDAVRILLVHGADPNVEVEHHGLSPLDFAGSRVIKAFIEEYSKVRPRWPHWAIS